MTSDDHVGWSVRLCESFLRLSDRTAISARGARIHGLGIREIRTQLANCRSRIRRWNSIERDAKSLRRSYLDAKEWDLGRGFRGGSRSPQRAAAQMRKRDDHRDSSLCVIIYRVSPPSSRVSSRSRIAIIISGHRSPGSSYEYTSLISRLPRYITPRCITVDTVYRKYCKTLSSPEPTFV